MKKPQQLENLRPQEQCTEFYPTIFPCGPCYYQANCLELELLVIFSFFHLVWF